eukprot:384647_1
MCCFKKHSFCLNMSSHLNPKKRKQQNINDEPLPKKMKLNTLPSKPTTEIIDTLAILFQKMEKSRKITIGGQSSLPSTPGLYIEGIGSIPLPICDQQLSTLLSLHSKSSNCLELQPSQFHFANPNWNKNMQQLLQSIAISLGCNHETLHNIEAHLDSLLICNTGGHFPQLSNNTNTKHVIFSKVIIQIPSTYKVIDNKPILSLKYNNKIFDYDFGVPFSYWPEYTYYPYIAANYESLKDELLNNKISTLTMDEWDQITMKAQTSHSNIQNILS